MYNEDSELLLISDNEDLRGVCLNQNDDSQFTYDDFESSENFGSGKSCTVPSFGSCRNVTESSSQECFAGKFLLNYSIFSYQCKITSTQFLFFQFPEKELQSASIR